MRDLIVQVQSADRLNTEHSPSVQRSKPPHRIPPGHCCLSSVGCSWARARPPPPQKASAPRGTPGLQDGWEQSRGRTPITVTQSSFHCQCSTCISHSYIYNTRVSPLDPDSTWLSNAATEAMGDDANIRSYHEMEVTFPILHQKFELGRSFSISPKYYITNKKFATKSVIQYSSNSW